MRGGIAVVLAAIAVVLGSCRDNEPALPPKEKASEPLTRFEFTIGSVRYAIAMPDQAAMRPHGTDGAIFYARKMQRQQKTMTLGPDPRAPDQDFDQPHFKRDRRCKAGTSDPVVRFRHLGRTGEGSGGSIEEIAGRIQIGPHILFFDCADQGEMSIRATWCLDYIDSIEVIPPASSGNG